jgi:hypothetical protein
MSVIRLNIPSQLLVGAVVVRRSMQHVRGWPPACGDRGQYPEAVAGVVGLHRRRRRPGVLGGDPNAQHTRADPEADRWFEYDGLAVDTQRDRSCGVDLEGECRPLSQ